MAGELTDEQRKMLMNFGALGYPLAKILSIMDLDDPQGFESDFSDPDSEIAKIYQKGAEKAQYLIDLKLFEMAQAGDLRALEKHEERKRALNPRRR